jgi:hypothetical protein
MTFAAQRPQILLNNENNHMVIAKIMRALQLFTPKI